MYRLLAIKDDFLPPVDVVDVASVNGWLADAPLLAPTDALPAPVVPLLAVADGFGDDLVGAAAPLEAVGGFFLSMVCIVAELKLPKK